MFEILGHLGHFAQFQDNLGQIFKKNRFQDI